MTELVRPHRVAFADTDASGRIHWTSVFRWAELAEHDLLRRSGVTDVSRFPRKATEAVYHRALAAGDEIEIRLAAERVGRTSVTYGWLVLRDGETCVEGRHTVVHVDDDGRPTPWPADVSAAFGQSDQS
ncbi:thioesterase family protein [Saccharopolyspora sp. WRP15-2]|uniref:Thioesterase family protein n=1 Tax=Saccharopolyspora oryzae TaxID=2997343 RepID=A0ABT4USB4_9PSEU|nr:thioesterase family protein [Saccharopolyspora oryzae]MDA3624610.1 thioesterase family protein [Saccharopolyspora oryzae]